LLHILKGLLQSGAPPPTPPVSLTIRRNVKMRAQKFRSLFVSYTYKLAADKAARKWRSRGEQERETWPSGPRLRLLM